MLLAAAVSVCGAAVQEFVDKHLLRKCLRRTHESLSRGAVRFKFSQVKCKKEKLSSFTLALHVIFLLQYNIQCSMTLWFPAVITCFISSA